MRSVVLEGQDWTQRKCEQVEVSAVAWTVVSGQYITSLPSHSSQYLSAVDSVKID